MSIFIRAAKQLLLQYLDKAMKIADAKDFLLGIVRIAELSEEQRKKSLKLRVLIENYVPKKTDIESLADLRELITATNVAVRNVRVIFECDPGHLNDTLTNMNSALELFYKTISQLSFQLYDVPDSQHPFTILCAYAIYYFGEDIFKNIFNPSDKQYVNVTGLGSLIGLPSAVTIRKSKETCLLTHLKACQGKLPSVKEGKEHDELRINLVRFEAEAIRRENEAICKNAQTIPTLPLTLTFFAKANVKAPTGKPSRGRLERCMNGVLAELTELEQQKSVISMAH
jgi:hypothetical protein